MSSTMVNYPRLRCILTNDPTSDTKADNNTVWFDQEEGKKSSFLLRLPTDFSIEKPAHLLIHCVVGKDILPFLFGGLELISNARIIEAYKKEESNPSNENYLQTARGIKEDGDTDIHKSVLVCPKGPETVVRLNLKLLSLRPATCTKMTLLSMKLKGRLPNVEMMSAADHVPSEPVTATETQGPQHFGMSQTDMTAAMAGITMLVGSTETKISKGLREGLMTLNVAVGQRIQQLELGFGAVLNSHKVALEQQNVLIQQQQELIMNQSKAIEILNEQQIQLLGIVAEMRDDMKEQNAALLVARESREFASSVAEQVEEHVGEVNCEDFMEMKLDNAEQEGIDAAIDDDTVAVVLDSTDKGDGMTQDVLVPKAWIPEPGEGEMPKLWIPDPEAHPDHKATKNDFPTMMEEVDVEIQVSRKTTSSGTDADLIAFSEFS